MRVLWQIYGKICNSMAEINSSQTLHKNKLSPVLRKPAFSICERECTDQLRCITMQLISAFVFTTLLATK